jgi:hypothetical protein
LYHERISTNGAERETIAFEKGSTAYGYMINFSNGETFYWSAVENSPYPGTVTNGVIWPRYQEIRYQMFGNLNLIDPRVDQPQPREDRDIETRHTQSGVLPFEIGDTVCGDLTFSNGSYFKHALIINSPYSGTVSDGTLWPYEKLVEVMIAESTDYDDINRYKFLGPNTDFSN